MYTRIASLLSNRNFHLLRDPRIPLDETTRLPPKRSRTRIRTLTAIQYPVHTPVFLVYRSPAVLADMEPPHPSRLARIVLVCLPSTEGTAQLVGARYAGEFADGGDD